MLIQIAVDSHTSCIISGRMKVKMDDGPEVEGEFSRDTAIISPGHDARVVGDEPCVSFDFTGMADFAKKS